MTSIPSLSWGHLQRLSYCKHFSSHFSRWENNCDFVDEVWYCVLVCMCHPLCGSRDKTRFNEQICRGDVRPTVGMRQSVLVVSLPKWLALQCVFAMTLDNNKATQTHAHTNDCLVSFYGNYSGACVSGCWVHSGLISNQSCSIFFSSNHSELFISTKLFNC